MYPHYTPSMPPSSLILVNTKLSRGTVGKNLALFLFAIVEIRTAAIPSRKIESTATFSFSGKEMECRKEKKCFNNFIARRLFMHTS